MGREICIFFHAIPAGAETALWFSDNEWTLHQRHLHFSVVRKTQELFWVQILAPKCTLISWTLNRLLMWTNSLAISKRRHQMWKVNMAQAMLPGGSLSQTHINPTSSSLSPAVGEIKFSSVSAYLLHWETFWKYIRRAVGGPLPCCHVPCPTIIQAPCWLLLEQTELSHQGGGKMQFGVCLRCWAGRSYAFPLMWTPEALNKGRNWGHWQPQQGWSSPAGSGFLSCWLATKGWLSHGHWLGLGL